VSCLAPAFGELYDEAKGYIDGKWLTVAIASTDDLHEVMELLAMKRPPPSPGHPIPGTSPKTSGR
jgi:hypothetical protein